MSGATTTPTPAASTAPAASAQPAATPVSGTVAGSVAGRAPATVLAASGLSILVAGFGAYGAVYFTGLEGFTDLGLTFLVAYEFLSVLGLVSAIALLRGRAAGHLGVLAFGLWMTVFTVFKVAYIHEAEAVPFGVVGLAILALALAPATRRFVRG
jgi:hypothetical protein